MLYTSYFANVRKLPPTVTPVGICAFAPRWFKGENETRLAPSRELLALYKSGQYTMLDYWDRYYAESLIQLDPNRVYQELTVKGTPDVALCCYEVPMDFCHRHILGHWFATTIGVVIREYGDHPIVFGG